MITYELTTLIVSHEHKYIFFAVPKTATHTVREALRAHLGADDWEQQVLFGEQFLPIAQSPNSVTATSRRKKFSHIWMRLSGTSTSSLALCEIPSTALYRPVSS